MYLAALGGLSKGRGGVGEWGSVNRGRVGWVCCLEKGVWVGFGICGGRGGAGMCKLQVCSEGVCHQQDWRTLCHLSSELCC